MFPDKIAKTSEHSHQAALFQWARMALLHGFDAAFDEKCYESKDYANITYGVINAVNKLELLHAIPNGGSRGDTEKSRKIAGGVMKAEGVKPGIPDIFLPVPKLCNTLDFEIFGGSTPFYGVICGLYIEMKKPAEKPVRGGKGGLSDSQIYVSNLLMVDGYAVVVCYSWKEAANIIVKYLN